MINAKRIPLDITPEKYIEKELLSYSSSERVCCILPTKRFLHLIANYNIINVELFTIKEFTTYTNRSHGINLPKELRAYYLRKASEKLSKDDKITLFHNENSILLDNFITFTQVSSGIFSFYRELAAEQVETKKLANAGKYTDYELQITVLEKLWEYYIKEVRSNGLTESWESYKKIDYNSSFLSRYDKFIFLIGGYLTNYELSYLKKISEQLDVTLIFNFAGKKGRLYKTYEKYLNIDIEDRTDTILSDSSVKIISCNSITEQIQLITDQIFYFNKEHNIPFENMAVIIPEDWIKSYFLRMDRFNLFDISSNEDINSSEIFQILSLAGNILEEYIVQDKKIKIETVITILEQPIIKRNFSTSSYINKLYQLISNNRIFLYEKDITNIKPPFISEIYTKISYIKRVEKVSIVINFIQWITETFTQNIDCIELNNTKIILYELERLRIIYNKIVEEVPIKESYQLILNNLSLLKCITPKGPVLVTGILESRNMSYELLFIPAMNEGLFPPNSEKDLFLNTEIRLNLRLPTYIDREELMKNYLLQIMERTKINIISYSKSSKSKHRSRFVEEISIKNNLIALEYKPVQLSILSSKSSFYPNNEDIIIYKDSKIINKIKNYKYSATSLKDYLECSLRFYLKRVSKVIKTPEVESKITPMIIGNALHCSMKNLFDRNITIEDLNYSNILKEDFQRQLEKLDSYQHSSYESFKTKIIEENIDKIVKLEKELYNNGYRTVNRELEVECKFNEKNIIGKIDRIDIVNSQLVIIDYKYKDASEYTSYRKKDETDLQAPIYALLLEKNMNQIPSEVYLFFMKDKPKVIKSLDISEYDYYKEKIKDTLDEIFDVNIPFKKTDKVDNCRYCDYKEICGRNSYGN